MAISLGIKSRNEADVSVGYASLVAVTFYAAELIGAPLFGAWSDRIGRKPLMILGPVLGGIAAQLMGLTMLIPVLVLVRILQGLSTASAAPATLGFLSAQTATSDKLRGRVMGFYEAATVVGLAGGGWVAGQLHDRFGAVRVHHRGGRSTCWHCCRSCLCVTAPGCPGSSCHTAACCREC